VDDNELLIATAKATQSQEWQEMWLDKNTSIWPWNPFRYKGDAFALIDKYDVWLESDGDGWSAMCDGYIKIHVDLTQAICLAIVEAQ